MFWWEIFLSNQVLTFGKLMLLEMYDLHLSFFQLPKYYIIQLTSLRSKRTAYWSYGSTFYYYYTEYYFSLSDLLVQTRGPGTKVQNTYILQCI